MSADVSVLNLDSDSGSDADIYRLDLRVDCYRPSRPKILALHLLYCHCASIIGKEEVTRNVGGTED